MAIARSMAKREFVLSCDKQLPPEQQTKFFLIPMSAQVEAELNDLVSTDSSAYVEVTEGDRSVKTPIQAGYFEKRLKGVEKCLVGWSNYKDGEGNEIDFAKHTPEERLALLYPAWVEELAAFIDSMSVPTEAALKN